MHRLTKLLGILPLLCSLACASSYADRQPNAFAGSAPAQAPQFSPVTVSVERPHGGAYESFLFGGSQFIVAQEGQPYTLRLTNNTHERVEAVVSVDGRDVVSGEIGNYKKQRGYVIEPYSSVLIEGFRQSLDHVAAFRFTALAGSYTAQRGSPEHAGIIGVAVFREKQRRTKKQAIAPIQQPPPTFGPPPRAADAAQATSPAAEAEAPAAAEDAAPPAAFEGRAKAAPSTGADSGFAPAPVPRNQLGTGYGESTYSAVSQVDFKRARRRKPDAILTLHYDSAEGLRARGVPVGSTPAIAF